MTGVLEACFQRGVQREGDEGILEGLDALGGVFVSRDLCIVGAFWTGGVIAEGVLTLEELVEFGLDQVSFLLGGFPEGFLGIVVGEGVFPA